MKKSKGRSTHKVKAKLTLRDVVETAHAAGAEVSFGLVPTDLFSYVKYLYQRGRNWNYEQTNWCGYDQLRMAKVFSGFAPYFLVVYNNFFVETNHGPARVTAISDEGIRIETLQEPTNYEWLHGELDVMAWGLKVQPTITELMAKKGLFLCGKDTKRTPVGKPKRGAG